VPEEVFGVARSPERVRGWRAGDAVPEVGEERDGEVARAHDVHAHAHAMPPCHIDTRQVVPIQHRPTVFFANRTRCLTSGLPRTRAGMKHAGTLSVCR